MVPTVVTVNWTLTNEFHWNFSPKSNIFIHENAFEHGSHFDQASTCRLQQSVSTNVKVKVIV